MRQKRNQSFRLWAGRLLTIVWLALSITAPAHAATDDLHAHNDPSAVEVIDGQSQSPAQSEPDQDHFCHAASCHVHWHGARSIANAGIKTDASLSMTIAHFDYVSQIISPDLRPPMS
ncbi:MULTISPECIES: hypothetical protein [Euryhalocaulis]|uniref:hypothetical protein n=1 Tax=Euryhalocaulis TaxID=1712422 RepID=UPI0003B51798|nr:MULTISPECIES: hypothetical protein [Euryhalocaulis]MBA4801362.1 hypothetical protein [Euryhalocaulis sp.]